MSERSKELATELKVDARRHFDASQPNHPSKMGVVVRDGIVHVPAELGTVLEQVGVHDVAGLVATLDSFPTPILVECHLTHEQFIKAKKDMFVELKGHGVKPDYFQASMPFKPSFGAMPRKQVTEG